MDAAYVQFLQTYLPRLALRWQGFRKVRTQVVKRLKRRLCALQPSWIAAGLTRDDTWYVVQDALHAAIDFVEQDMRRELPAGVFHLILCRNVVLTYFTEPVQRDILAQLVARLVPGGVLVVGTHEALPQDGLPLTAYGGQPGIFRKVAPQG